MTFINLLFHLAVLKNGRQYIRKMSTGRIRQHVNPLSATYQEPTDLPEAWISTYFKNPNFPFFVDIGCGLGSFVLQCAKLEANINFLGIDIRKPVIAECLTRQDRAGLTKQNVHFLASNANIDLPRLLTDIAKTSHVQMICVHHPDPQFKLRHKKRRVVNPLMVEQIANRVNSGCFLYLQSDLEDVLLEMANEVNAHPAFLKAPGFSMSAPDTNPIVHKVKTEREIASAALGRSIYRMMFVRQ